MCGELVHTVHTSGKGTSRRCCTLDHPKLACVLTWIVFLKSVWMVPKNALSQHANAIALSSVNIFSAVHPFVSNLLRSVLMVPRAPEMTNCSPVLSTATLFGMLIRDWSSTWRVKALALLCIACVASVQARMYFSRKGFFQTSAPEYNFGSWYSCCAY